MALNIIFFCMTSESPLKAFAYVMDFRILFMSCAWYLFTDCLIALIFKIHFYLCSLISSWYFILFPTQAKHVLFAYYVVLTFKVHMLFFPASHNHPFSFSFFLPYLISGSFQTYFFFSALLIILFPVVIFILWRPDLMILYPCPRTCQSFPLSPRASVSNECLWLSNFCMSDILHL